jgi:polyribonucleotide nucleotidyltransferase
MSVFGNVGDTTVLSTVVVQPADDLATSDSEKPPHNDESMIPLTVAFRERFSAAGLIPYSSTRKDNAMPTDSETLSCRIIDRIVRPLLHHTTDNIDVTASVYSYSRAAGAQTKGDITQRGFDQSVLATNSAAAALYAAGLLKTPVAAVKIGIRGDEMVCDPSRAFLKDADGFLLYAGCREGAVMVEFEAGQERDVVGVCEEKVAELMRLAHEKCEPIWTVMEELKEANQDKNKRAVSESDTQQFDEIYESVETTFETEAYGLFGRTEELSKTDRGSAEASLLAKISSALAENSNENAPGYQTMIMERLLKKSMRDAALKDSLRSDGRNPTTVRPVTAICPVLPDSVHGSAVFSRGETQVLATVTLGPPGDGQMIRDPYVPMKLPEVLVVKDEVPVGR